MFSCKFITAEAVAWRCSVKNVFLKISQNSQENTGSGRLQHRCLPKNFKTFFKNTYPSEPLLLEQLYYYFPYFFSKIFHVFLLTKVINNHVKGFFKILQYYRKTPALGSLFNNAAVLKPWNFTKSDSNKCVFQ